MEDSLSFAYAVLKAIEGRIELTEQNILQGSPDSMEKYRQLVGELDGLQYAKTEIKERLDRLEKEE
jgi:hypothetical protein|tara:strand:+ start:267 stop:464 length:198 start_codon:yes stop_codon:yes gene_type:complete